MRKSAIVFVVLVIVGIGGYFGVTKYDIRFGTLQFAFSKEKAILRDLSTAFLEDIQFKDFDKASSYHSEEDQQEVDIADLIERMFQIKPELLDIMKYEITDIDIDNSGTRARVKTHTTVKVLNTDEMREPDVILYWHKIGDRWYMKLESSLQ
jgi:hypothetical protein